MAAKLNNEALATTSVATLPHQAVGDPHLAVWGERFSGLTWVGDKAWEIIIQIQLGPSHWGSGEPWIQMAFVQRGSGKEAETQEDFKRQEAL